MQCRHTGRVTDEGDPTNQGTHIQPVTHLDRSIYRMMNQAEFTFGSLSLHALISLFSYVLKFYHFSHNISAQTVS